MPKSTLLIRLDGPMQAWGSDSRYGLRHTRETPTKSGVIGLIGCALGWGRDADVSVLSRMPFGVRTDRAGVLRRDFHTAGKDGYYKAGGSVERKNVIVSERFFLSGACFWDMTLVLWAAV